MKALFLSDTHSRHRKFEGFLESLDALPDVVFHTGDFSQGWNPEPTDLLDCMSMLRHHISNTIPILVVPGNHDIFLDPIKVGLEKVLNLIQALKQDNIHVLIGDTFNHLGKSFVGIPWTPVYGRSQAYMFYEDTLADLYKNIKPEHDVILSHGPPYGFLDKVESYQSGDFKSIRVGSKSLWKRLDALRKEDPRKRFVFFGHIHENQGMRIIQNYVLYNGSLSIQMVDI